MPLTIGLGPVSASGGGGESKKGLSVYDLDYVSGDATATVDNKTITEFPRVDTSFLTSTLQMFRSCTELESLKDLDFSHAKNMSSMFAGCSKLKEVNLYTPSATSMSSMFEGCSSLVSVELDTKNVGSMAFMFKGCSSLKGIPLFDTSNASHFNGMFLNCTSLEDVPELSTNKVSTYMQMFYGCTSLMHVKLGVANICTAMASMFQGCENLETVELNVSAITGMSSSFKGCTALRSCNLLGLKASPSFPDSPLLSKESVLYIFENAQTVTTSQTITLHADVFDQLTEDEIAIATEKGFSVVSA